MLRQNETAEGILRAPAHGAEEAAGVQVERVDQHDEPVLRIDRRRGTEPEPGPSPTDLKRPAIPDLDVQEARILFRNSALLRHLRTHSDGDWVKNPQRKVAGKHTLPKTKDRKADSIKKVVRDWLLTTPQGKRALAAADVAEGELSIDRVLARHDKQHGMSLNCIYNLYLMPVRHNSYFGDTCSAEKRAYIGERAYKLAREAHDAFVRDREGDYDWDAAFAKRALFIVST